ncbi:hypothetical protein [Dyadobacter sp. 676]|uniref:Uncharacterized protein n=1 Tax=Dyadobacter sp. 676 TaxID=3088362 RepID=A0AAU8FFC4_9BACT
MKYIINNLFAICLLCSSAHAQQIKGSNSVAQLQTLVEQTGPDQPTSVHLLADKRALQIGDLIVPLAKTTLIRSERDGGKYQVKFFLQNGTAITKVSDPNFRRAYWALSLQDKKACEQFVTLFKELQLDEKG